MTIMSLAVSCLPRQKYTQLLLETKKKKLQYSPYFSLSLDDTNDKLEITSELQLHFNI